MANEFKVKKGLIVNGSGSTILNIQGSQGQLFSVTDQLSGSLFSVNDISGIPVLEAFSDDTVKIGTFGNEAIIVEGSQTTIQDLIATGSFTGSFTGSYTGSFIGDGSGLTDIDYNNLNNTPTIGDGRLTINTSGIATGTTVFDANQTTDDTVTINVPGTNLGLGGSGNSRSITSSTGTNVSIPIASTSTAGFMSTEDRTRLNNITGTQNFVAKFGASSALGNSQIFDNGTNVGIGTTTPTSKVHVLADKREHIFFDTSETGLNRIVGFFSPENTKWEIGPTNKVVGTVGPRIDISGKSYGGQNDSIRFITGDTSSMQIISNGNVGINTTSPSEKLDVDGNIKTSLSFITSNTAGMRSLDSNTLEVGDIKSSNKSTLITAYGAGTTANTQIQLDDGEITIGGGASNRITTITDIPSGGKTKIGDIDGIVNSSTLSIDGVTTTNPQFTFNTTGNQIVELSNTTSGGSELFFNPISSGYSRINVAKNTTPLSFAIGGSTVMTVAISEDVGIGTTTPSAKLEVEDTSGGNYLQGLRVTNASDTTNTSTGIRFQTAASSTTVSYSEIRSIRTNLPTTGGTELTFSTTPSNSATTASERMRIDGSGFVGINETSPSQRLHVDGNILATGNITANSDKRLKENIQHIENPLDIIKQLNGYTYTRNDLDDKTRRHTGVIAQEVLKVLPEAVHGSEEDKYSVAYGNMVGVLIEAIKEQQSQIEELKKLIK